MIPLLPLAPPVVALAEEHARHLAHASARSTIELLVSTHLPYYRNLNIPDVRDAWVRWWWVNCEGSITELRDDALAMRAALVEAFEGLK